MYAISSGIDTLNLFPRQALNKQVSFLHSYLYLKTDLYAILRKGIQFGKLTDKR